MALPISPVVFTGHQLPWAAGPLRYLEQKIGHRKVSIHESPDVGKNSFVFKHKSDFTPNDKVRKLLFRDFAAALRKAEETKLKKTLYMQSTPISELLPELLNATKFPLVPKISGRIWIGNGQKVWTHFDPAPNLVHLVTGRKKFILFPPQSLPNMYIGPLDKSPYGVPISLVDPWNPDFKKFPKFKQALKIAWVADMKPGDTLFLPAFWWHAVESNDLNIMINYWWDEGVGDEFFGLSFLTGLLTARHFPEHLKKIWEIFFDYFILQKNGDPYSYLPKKLQGFAGAYSRKSEKKIKDKIKRRLSYL